MPAVNVDAGDAAELAELLRFLHDWMSAEHHHLDASLRHFVGNVAYDIDQLRADLARITFLLGHDDAKPRSPATTAETGPRVMISSAAGSCSGVAAMVSAHDILPSIADRPFRPVLVSSTVLASQGRVARMFETFQDS